MQSKELKPQSIANKNWYKILEEAYNKGIIEFCDTAGIFWCINPNESCDGCPLLQIPDCPDSHCLITNSNPHIPHLIPLFKKKYPEMFI